MNVYVVTMCVCSLRLYPACCVHNLTSPDLSLSLCVYALALQSLLNGKKCLDHPHDVCVRRLHVTCWSRLQDTFILLKVAAIQSGHLFLFLSTYEFNFPPSLRHLQENWPFIKLFPFEMHCNKWFCFLVVVSCSPVQISQHS